VPFLDAFFAFVDCLVDGRLLVDDLYCLMVFPCAGLIVSNQVGCLTRQCFSRNSLG